MKPPPPRFDSAAKAPPTGGQGKDGATDSEPSKAEGGRGGAAAPSSSMPPPPPGKAFAPPPPRFSSSDTGDDGAEAAKKSAARAAAVAAAAAAAAGATPAQRERLVAEAASSAIASASASEAAKEVPSAHQAPGSSRDAPEAPPAPREPPALSYEPPAWGGPPEGIQYALEVLKGGQVVENLDISLQNHYTFGRSPNNHVTLDHPSSSRLHAVIQYELGTGNMFVYDNSSTHGTFLNKKRLKGKVYAPVRVGDIIKFGQSTRLYLVTGPDELRPDEGPSMQQRQEMRMLAAQADRREHEAQVAKAQMAQALSKSGVGSNSQGASWGLLGEDAENEDEDPGAAEGELLDWRVYAETKGLTEKQQKTADKIRKYEWKIKNMQTEADRIRAKENGSDGLSVGQATQLARNEQAIEKIQEEMEDLEEVLLDSIRASVRGKKDAAAKEAGDDARKASKRKAGSDEDESDGEDDDFYDRTISKSKRSKGLLGAPQGKGTGKKKATQKAVTVEELFGRKEALLAEAKRLREAVALEEAVAGGEQQQQEDKGGGAEPFVDPLDAFMSSVETAMEVDKLKRLQEELKETETEAAETERLLKIADPDGWFRPKSKAAVDAKAKAANELLLARQRKAAEEAAKAAAKQREAEAVPFVPEVEEEEEEEPQGLQLQQHRRRQQPEEEEEKAGEPSGASAAPSAPELPPVASSRVEPKAAEGKQEQEEEAEQKAQEQKQESHSSVKMRIVAPKGGRSSVAKAKIPGAGRPTAAGGGGGGGLLSREELLRQQGGPDSKSKAAAAVADALAVLSRGKAKGGAEEGGEGGNGSGPGAMMADWKPPEGQTGDGRTALNDKLGY